MTRPRLAKSPTTSVKDLEVKYIIIVAEYGTTFGTSPPIPTCQADSATRPPVFDRTFCVSLRIFFYTVRYCTRPPPRCFSFAPTHLCSCVCCTTSTSRQPSNCATRRLQGTAPIIDRGLSGTSGCRDLWPGVRLKDRGAVVKNRPASSTTNQPSLTFCCCCWQLQTRYNRTDQRRASSSAPYYPHSPRSRHLSWILTAEYNPDLT